MQQIKFSFIVPVHNGIKYIKECIDSILAQEYQNFEIIVLENASDDGTKEYLEGLKNNKIKIISSDQLLSIEENWARIINIPRNEFMIIACADDVYYRNYLSEIIKLIQKYPNASLYRTHLDIIDKNSQKFSSSISMKKKLNQSDYLKGRLTHTYFETIMGYCFKSKDYDKIGGIDCVHNLLHADDVMLMKLIGKSFMSTSKKYACCYRSHADSVSTTPNPDIATDGFEYFFNYIHSLNNPQLNKIVKKYLPFHIENISRFFNNEHILRMKKMYDFFDIDESKNIYKIRKFFRENFAYRKEHNLIRIKCFRFKTKIKTT